MAERPLFSVDFNELMDFDIILLSQADIKKDADGNDVQLVEGLSIAIYEDDIGTDGQPDNLVAEGVVIPNKFTGSFPHVKWCCRISPQGIRHQSDLTAKRRMTSPEIHRIATLDLNVRPFAWAFARDRQSEIAAHFAEKQCEKPELWNGRVLLGCRAARAGERLEADYFETDFASFLAWRDWGFPDKAVFNGFGMGALQSSDGAFLLGEMGDHTSNAGRIYFPAGTPDPNDVSGGVLDIAGSIVREIAEETGLSESEYKMAADWTCVLTGPAIAMIRILRVAMPGEALKGRVEAHLASEAKPELRAVRLVRGRADLVPAMPRFVSAFLEAQF